MKLESYRHKRNFERTAEPRGGRLAPRHAYRFVIQKHAARHLHYDFRLELNGTLKSWAVPKGPSLDPHERRLAVHVEDHPIEYGHFEGIIPKPEYGAGTVMVWDSGTWRPQGDPVAGYRRGRLRFELDGEKLHGKWNLVRTGARGGDKENWLLIKSRDEYAGDADIISELPNSVRSGRDLREIAAGEPPHIRNNRTKARKGNARSQTHGSTALPEALRPQLATPVERIPTEPGWLHEIKYDGYRVLCRLARGRATLFSRAGQNLTPRMEAIAHAVERLSGFGDAWLDGEVVVVDAEGRTSFNALQLALSQKHNHDLVYYLFDLPFVNGRNLTDTPLIERKRQLARLLGSPRKTARVRYSDHAPKNGEVFYEYACKFGLEGVVSKRADSPYRSARTRDWVKVKCRLQQEFVVGGFSNPGGTRKEFGALLLGVFDKKGVLRYCGRTGTGFDARLLKSLRARLGRLAQRESPFAGDLPREARKDVHWVRPETVVNIAFTRWTHDGRVRQAVFQGLREDKPAKDVVREIPEPQVPNIESEARARHTALAVPIPARLTHADKVLYPEQGLTKGDLAAYYTVVADRMLPSLARRPLTLLRCPEGRHKTCFFQKHLADDAPASLLRVPIADEAGKHRTYLAVNSLDGVLALVQMGVLEIHQWGSMIDRPELPDQLVFDLDPDPSVPWTAVIDAAHLVHARLHELGLTGFLRTTGGKGLHVVTPIARRLNWREAKSFAKAFTEAIVRQDPKHYTARLPRAARRGKIFIDYLRNGHGATAIANYSTRARTGATIAVPLTWAELTSALEPARYTVITVPDRVKSLKHDPWAGFDTARHAVTRAMMRAVGLTKPGK